MKLDIKGIPDKLNKRLRNFLSFKKTFNMKIALKS